MANFGLKLIRISLVFLLFQANTFAQEETPKLESIYGIQLGLLGLNAHKEIPVSEAFVLRPEVGFLSGFAYSSFSGWEYQILPQIQLGSRYYYNLNRRLSKDKSIAGNAANFFGLRTMYLPDWFAISNKIVDKKNSVYFLADYGIRRNIGKHFNYEFTVSYVYGFDFYSYGTENSSGLVLDFKIGYKFH